MWGALFSALLCAVLSALLTSFAEPISGPIAAPIPGATEPSMLHSVARVLGSGDITAFGILRTAVVFLIAGELFVRAHQNTIRSLVLVALLVLFYALNTQLDLQTTLTNVVKDHALENGWYESRRKIQRAFVITLGAGGVLGAGLSVVFFRRAPRLTRLMLPGLLALYGYAFLRAAAFHRMELMSLAPAAFALLEGAAISVLLIGLRRQKADFLA